MSKMTYLWLSGVFFQALNTLKLVFGRSSAPEPSGGAYDAPPDPIVDWGGDTPSPYPSPIPTEELSRLTLGLTRDSETREAVTGRVLFLTLRGRSRIDP